MVCFYLMNKARIVGTNFLGFYPLKSEITFIGPCKMKTKMGFDICKI